MTVANHRLHLRGRHLFERLLDELLRVCGVSINDGVQPFALEPVLDDTEASLDWVVLRRVGCIDDACDAECFEI